LLDRLPDSIAEEDPALLVARAWSCEYLCRSCAEEHIRKAEERLVSSPPGTSEHEVIQGWIDALRAIQEYNLGHTEKALTCAEQALVYLPTNAETQRGYALIIRALCHQAMGDLQGCLGSLHAVLQDHSANATPRSMALIGLGYANWIEGDLVAMRRAALQNLQLGQERGLRSSIAYAQYHLGILQYVRNECAQAEQSLQAVINLRFFASQAEYCHAAFGLALVRLKQGRSEEAREVIESVSQRALEIGSPPLVELVHAFEAEVDLRVGRKQQALRWAETYSPEPFGETYMFYVPQLTLAKVWLADARPESRRAAAALLDTQLDRPHAAHNVPFRIQALALRALADAAGDDELAAVANLTKALELAAPGGFVRPFVDLGAPMRSLLDRLPAPGGGTKHAEGVLAAFGAERPAKPGAAPARTITDGAGTLVEPLTNREQDVLELLAQRLRDKEIAEKLFISAGTVKSHLKTLYQKLRAGDRRQAVARARELGILPPP
jgi:LuxR family maltose regulon positive regulatory protein